jgi:hypothetical protein
MNNEDPPKRYFASEARQLRHEFFHRRLSAHVGEIFVHYANLRSAAFVVAQFYSDNAWDEVHMRLVFSEFETPDLHAGLSLLVDDKEDHINLPTHGALNYEYSYRFVRDHLTTNIELADEVAIPLFAAFCKEGCHQDLPPAESYSLCATIRRRVDGTLDVEVAPILRPWLDGVALHSQWDDAANLGTSDPAEDQFAPRWMKEQQNAPTRRHGLTGP